MSGASSDTGTALIKRIADDYDNVLCHYRSRPEKIDELQTKFGEKIIRLEADLSDESQTIQLSNVVSGYGVTHFVHLPAVAIRPERFAKQPWGKFMDEMNVSVRSAVILSGKLLPAMAKAKFGRVVFMLTSYTVAEPPPKFMVPYTTSKYALLGLMKSLAAEYAGKGVAINGVSPGMMDTFFLEGTSHLIVEKNAEESPIKRNLVPEDVIGAFEFLLSKQAACITGQNLAVTAGA